MERVSLSHAVITGGLAMATASSFFIMPGLTIQPFYVFFLIALIATGATWRHDGARNLSFLKIIWREYGAVLAIFLAGIALNLLFYAYQHSGSFTVLFLPDYIRTISAIIFGGLIIVQGFKQPGALRWIRYVFFVPLVLSPLLLVGDTLRFSSHVPLPVFDGYKLQGMQANNPTSLATWLVITFALCAVPAFNRVRTRKQRLVYAFLATVAMALIWWTNSRAALLSVFFTLAVIIYYAVTSQRMRWYAAASGATFIIVAGFLILPGQAKTAVLVRFYPQYTASAVKQNFHVPQRILLRQAVSLTPDFFAGQERGKMWAPCPRYLLLHPLGSHGGGRGLTDLLGCGFHNSFFVAVEWGGWLAGVAFAVFTGKILYGGFRRAFRGPARHYEQALWSTLAFAGLIIFAMLNGFIQLKTLWVIAALVAACVISKDKESSTSAI